ncbi:MAG: hypothetical protein R3B54_00990 [Bdellovibrionota bacterium]
MGLTRYWEAGVGYQFRPSPLTDEAASGSANLLDSGTHVLGAAMEYDLGDRSWMPFP